jgi:hypothetical protein
MLGLLFKTLSQPCVGLKNSLNIVAGVINIPSNL